MSGNTTPMDESLKKIIDEVDEVDALSKRRSELSLKELEIKETRADIQLGAIRKTKKDFDTMMSSDLRANLDDVDDLAKKFDNVFDAADGQKQFLTPDFDTVVNFYRGNILTAYAHTGGGKSTLVSNIVDSMIADIAKDKVVRKILVISNEELEHDVFGRIAMLKFAEPYKALYKLDPSLGDTYRNPNYKNLKRLDARQRADIKNYSKMLSKAGIVTVMDDNWRGTTGCTTTPEGIEATFEKIIESKIKYDVIILDYFQGIFRSKLRSVPPHDAQHQAIFTIDRFKEHLPCPIVIMSQVKKPDKGKDGEINTFLSDFRQVGSRSLLMKSTDAIEMIPDFSTSTTRFLIHKSRHGTKNDNEIVLGLVNGSFVQKKDPRYIEKCRQIEDLKLKTPAYKQDK